MSRRAVVLDDDVSGLQRSSSEGSIPRLGYLLEDLGIGGVG